MHAEINRQRADSELGLGAKHKELAAASRKLDGLIEAVADGLRAPGLQTKLDDLEQRKRVLEADIAAAPPPMPRLRPNLAEAHRRKVEALRLDRWAAPLRA